MKIIKNLIALIIYNMPLILVGLIMLHNYLLIHHLVFTTFGGSIISACINDDIFNLICLTVTFNAINAIGLVSHCIQSPILITTLYAYTKTNTLIVKAKNIFSFILGLTAYGVLRKFYTILNGNLKYHSRREYRNAIVPVP